MKTILKLYISVLYEALLMLALVLALTAAYYAIVGDASSGLKRLGLQALLWLGMGAYFVRCWVLSGQTLASQTWKIKVVHESGRLLNTPEAIRRYLLASVLLLPAGLSLWWALIDREHCFLHDRLLRTRIVHTTI
jgi:uncharacterized RDD family membrane protein YckC